MKTGTQIRKVFCPLVLSLAVFGLASPHPTLAITPPMTDIGSLGGDFSNAFAINASGQVVGYSSTADNSSRNYAFIWDPVHGMQSLGNLADGHSSAYGINAFGQVVGASNPADASKIHAFLWDAAHGMQDLGALGDGDSQAYGINDLGQVVGYSGADGIYHAFVWDVDHGMQALGTLGGDVSVAWAINRAGQIVGQSATAGAGSVRAVLWDPIHGMQNLGTLGGSDSAAQAINGIGQIAGYSQTADGDGRSHAFVWDATNGMQDLGTLGGRSSQAFGINETGQVVGLSYLADDGTVHAFVWDATNGMRDLGTLGGWNSKAYGINDAGQIAGNSDTAQTTEHGFFLSPNPIPFSVKRGVLLEMSALRTEVTDHDDAKKLDDAIAELEKSLDPDLWSVDGVHLAAKHGEDVFKEEKNSVGKLQELTKKSPTYSATVQRFINTMVDVDRTLAQTAITNAAGGDPEKISEANGELAKGDASTTENKPTDAIEHYRRAWKKAQKARH